MEIGVMSSRPLPPIAQEAVLKLLAIGRAGASRSKGAAATAAAQERPSLRLEMGAPAMPMPTWPGLPVGSVPNRTTVRPTRRLPARRRGTSSDAADRQASFAGDN